MFGQVLETMGRKQAVIIGSFIIISATILFAISSHFNNTTMFYIIALSGRLFQGVGDSLINVVNSSIITIEFPESADLYLGYVEVAAGIGHCTAPLISSMVYTYLGFAGTYYFFAVLILVLGLIPALFLPKRLDNCSSNSPNDRSSFVSAFIENEQPVGYLDFVTNFRSVSAFMLQFLSFVCMIACDPILTVHLTDMGMSVNFAGYGFALHWLLSSLACPIVGLICRSVERRWILLSGIGLAVVSLFLLGPSKLLQLPNNIETIFIGLALLGVSKAALNIPVVPEMIDSISTERASGNGKIDDRT